MRYNLDKSLFLCYNIGKKNKETSMSVFRGDLYFLSNMYPCDVKINVAGNIMLMHSSETVFQALKCKNLESF